MFRRCAIIHTWKRATRRKTKGKKMKNHLDVAGVVVAFVTFFVLFFGFVAIPTGGSVALAVSVVGFIAAGVGLVAQQIANAFFYDGV